MSTGEGPIASFGMIPPGEVEAEWGAEWKKAALEWHDRVASISTEAEHMAYRQNYLDLDPTYTDKYGDPLARMTLDWTEHERAQGAMLTGRARDRSRRRWAREPRLPIRASWNATT